MEAKIKVTQKIVHEGEINRYSLICLSGNLLVRRARYMPQNPCLIATRAVSGDVLVFDYTKHPSNPTDRVCKPDIRLSGLTSEGYGLSWNSLSKGIVAACSEDGSTALWDLNMFSKEKKVLNPLRVYKGHASVVEDVQFNPFSDCIFATVGDDRKFMIWDMRLESNEVPSLEKHCHNGEVNCIGFNPFTEHIFATASSDKTVNLWDMRKLKSPVHVLTGHNDEVLQLQWSPHNETVLATSGADRRVLVWDLSKIGEEQSEEDAQDGPPELLFIHGGHTNKISDFAWNPNDPWVIGSAAEDNVVQVWQMASSIYALDEAEVGSEMVE